jgi:hypothetical protein
VIWIGLIWLAIGTSGKALVNMIKDLQVSQNVGKFLSSCRTDTAFQERPSSMELVLSFFWLD